MATVKRKVRRSERLANKRRKSSKGMYSDDEEEPSDSDVEEEPSDSDGHFQKGDIVFAWYYVDLEDKDTATCWWPAKIEDDTASKLRFFWQDEL